MRVLNVATLAILLGVKPLGAQGGEISLAILPFGALPAAGGANRTGPSLGEQAVSVVSASGLYTVVDRSADRAIEAELKKAESFRNFDSRVQLETTGKLNAAVLLIGVIEQQSIEVVRPKKAGEKASYLATLGVRIKLVRTATGEVIKTAAFTLRNGSGAADLIRDTKLGKLVPKALQEALSKEIEKQVAGAADKAKVDVRAQTADEAIRDAVESLKGPLSEFLENSFAAVMKASRAK